MVGEHPRRPCARAQLALDRLDQVAPGGRRPLDGERQEVERHMQFVALAVVGADGRRFVQVDLPHDDPLAGIGVDDPPDAAQQQVRTRVVVDPDAVELPEGRRLIGQGRILADEVGHVDPKAVDATIEPEAKDVVHCGDHLRVAPVQVGLLGQKQVQVPLAGVVVIRPCPAAEHRPPVVRRLALPTVAPEVPVPPRRVARRAGIDEPGVPIGGVVRHPVDQHAEAAVVRRGDQTIGILERAEDRIDVTIV